MATQELLEWERRTQKAKDLEHRELLRAAVLDAHHVRQDRSNGIVEVLRSYQLIERMARLLLGMPQLPR